MQCSTDCSGPFAQQSSLYPAPNQSHALLYSVRHAFFRRRTLFSANTDAEYAQTEECLNPGNQMGRKYREKQKRAIINTYSDNYLIVISY